MKIIFKVTFYVIGLIYVFVVLDNVLVFLKIFLNLYGKAKYQIQFNSEGRNPH